MSRTVLFAVNHLQGAGHLNRVLTLARAFAQAEHAAHVMTGGFPVPQFDTTGVMLHQIPAVRSDGPDFGRLLTPEGTVWDDAYFDRRCRAMIEVLDRVTPDILIFELFPLGRRILRHEYLALLDAVHARRTRPRIYCSIRDILAPPSKARKISFAEDVLTAHFDGVLVHSDPNVIRLEDSWPVTPAITPLLRYTGFVTPPLPEVTQKTGRGEILVSTGSGDMGDEIIHAALGAALYGRQWRCLVGGPDPARLSRFAGLAPRNVTLETPRPDFRELLQNAGASVSLCGYNTSMDLLQSGVPAVIVPYDAGAETEQSQRAAALQRLPGIERVALGDVTPPTLMKSLDKAQAAAPRDVSGLRFDGARETVRMLT